MLLSLPLTSSTSLLSAFFLALIYFIFSSFSLNSLMLSPTSPSLLMFSYFIYSISLLTRSLSYSANATLFACSLLVFTISFVISSNYVSLFLISSFSALF
jgi:hypothetical protein